MATIAEQVKTLLEQNKRQDFAESRNRQFWFDFFGNMKNAIRDAASYGFVNKFFSSDDIWLDMLMFSTPETHYVMTSEDGTKLMEAFSVDAFMKDAYSEFVSWTKEQGIVFEISFLRPYPEDMAKTIIEFSVAE